MKRAYLIHGWGGEPNEGFRPWLTKELEMRGYTVTSPKLPDANTPKMDEQLRFIQTLIQNPDDETVLVGHSLGCNLILRFLDALPPETRVGTTVLVAPAINAIVGLTKDEEAIAAPWLEDTIHIERVKKVGGTMTALFSDNDPHIPLSTVELLKQDYGMSVVIEHNKGHYSESDPVHETPEILAAIIA